VRLSQTCRSTVESARGEEGGAKETSNAHRNVLALATAVYVIVARGDAEY
jgi:hypothetical protein